MAIAMTVAFDGARLARYAAAIAHAGMQARAQRGPGCLLHWVAQTPSGVRVSDVWETREQFEAFAASHIVPAVSAAGLASEPNVEFREVTGYITAGPTANETLVRRLFDEFCKRAADRAGERAGDRRLRLTWPAGAARQRPVPAWMAGWMIRAAGWRAARE